MTNNKLLLKVWNFKGKKRQVLVLRNEGKIVSWKFRKGVSDKELKKIKRQAPKSKSLDTNIVSRTKFSTGVKKLIFKKRVAKFKRTTQTQCRLLVSCRRKKPQTFYGYSDRGLNDEQGKQQAFNRAQNNAIQNKYCNYKDLTIISKQFSFIAYEIPPKEFERIEIARSEVQA